MQNGTDRVSGGRPRAICVLGAGRSGTSLTARLLGLGGAYLGAGSELIAEQGIPANPRGFWEHRGIVRINDRLLEALGGSWSDPPPLPLPPSWERSEALAGERKAAGELLEGTFGGRDAWAWKDVRTSLTLPFWRGLLPAERCEVRYVVCLRNPLEVIASLAPLRPKSRRETAMLWLTYTASALVNTAGQPRLLLSYEDYFRDWRGTLERLLEFAGLPAPEEGGETEARMREFTDPALWRHRAGSEGVAGDREIPEQVAGLYLIAELLAKAEPDARLAAAADRYAERLLESLAGA